MEPVELDVPVSQQGTDGQGTSPGNGQQVVVEAAGGIGPEHEQRSAWVVDAAQQHQRAEGGAGA